MLGFSDPIFPPRSGQGNGLPAGMMFCFVLFSVPYTFYLLFSCQRLATKGILLFGIESESVNKHALMETLPGSSSPHPTTPPLVQDNSRFPRPAVRLPHLGASQSPGGFMNPLMLVTAPRVSHPAGVGLGPRLCTSRWFPQDAGAVLQGTNFEHHRPRTIPSTSPHPSFPSFSVVILEQPHVTSVPWPCPQEDSLA